MINSGKPSHYKGDMAMVDVVSLYPSQMRNAKNMYPYGESKWVEERDVNKLGFYEVMVHHREGIQNVLPKRDYEDKTVSLDWIAKEEFRTYCCSFDLDALTKHGHSFRVIRGLEF